MIYIAAQHTCIHCPWFGRRRFSMLFGHLPQIILLAALGLLVFGPKRVMEMGSSLGKAFREFQQATKDMNLSNLLTGED
ncbi:MAG: twin-arginine translocase TatA/TatE family subunit, partial [Ktedonobacterales bacterium]